MITYVQYLWNRYMGEKGQGLTEYAIILLLVVLIGILVWFTFDIRAQLSTIYGKISSDLSSIASKAN